MSVIIFILFIAEGAIYRWIFFRNDLAEIVNTKAKEMTRPHNGPTNLPVRKTMIKSTVGNVRKEAYDLPNSNNPNHTFGFPVERDPEGTGEILGKWVQAVPSKAAQSNRSFVATNKLALAAGCVDAKANRDFANHKTVRVKVVKKEKFVYDAPPNTIYGVKSEESEDFTALIQAKHTVFSRGEKDYPDLSTMHIKGKLPLPKETKSSIGKDVRLMEKQNAPSSFKLKKFQNVKSVLHTQPSNITKSE